MYKVRSDILKSFCYKCRDSINFLNLMICSMYNLTVLFMTHECADDVRLHKIFYLSVTLHDRDRDNKHVSSILSASVIIGIRDAHPKLHIICVEKCVLPKLGLKMNMQCII